MYIVGLCFYIGQGVMQDFAKAFEGSLKAAKNGHAAAMFIAGLCYYDGDGVTKDDGAAVKWLIEARDSGKADAAHA